MVFTKPDRREKKERLMHINTDITQNASMLNADLLGFLKLARVVLEINTINRV